MALYIELRTAQRQAIRARLYDILSLAAAQIDGDIHTMLVSPGMPIIATRLLAIKESTPDVVTWQPMQPTSQRAHSSPT